jgi:hypothetical protein
MRLDPDLLREVILALEVDPNRFDQRVPIEGRTWEETDAHIIPWIELGFIDGSVIRTTADADGPCLPTSCIN